VKFEFEGSENALIMASDNVDGSDIEEVLDIGESADDAGMFSEEILVGKSNAALGEYVEEED
jgi:hypothetical protein